MVSFRPVDAALGAAEVERQPQPVGDREAPGLGAQEARRDQQGEDRPAGPRLSRLDVESAEAEGDVGEVDVGAQAVGEERARG